MSARRPVAVVERAGIVAMRVLTVSMAVYRTVSVAMELRVLGVAAVSVRMTMPAVIDVGMAIMHRGLGVIMMVVVIAGAMLVGTTLDRRLAFAATTYRTHIQFSRTPVQAVLLNSDLEAFTALRPRLAAWIALMLGMSARQGEAEAE